MTSSYPRNPALLGLLVAGGLAFGGSAIAAPDGLYSTEELLDADVYTQANPDEEIGEVEDILLDNDMQIRALVIDTGNLLDMGEKQYVLETGQFTVETQNSDDLDDMEYRVLVDMSEEEVTQQPEYTNDWWQNARQSTQEAWEQTKEGAASAWENTQEGATKALDRIGAALENVGERTQEAASE
ncbi:PRC-barrel domain-containing protein [Halomonas sp. TRM85114]|uniref:PRC-barrel domain-containing protein n=1 Tax=Halomonas jincaotanensis TaxID=2810616 RepID=UPI001BD27C04|nr:PRC-barrel domain-containing protein [Halomonas jincaotanensis]MBS9404787.1 PRC-barrel domain-containing protein [Halomonas jincaotanensis]